LFSPTLLRSPAATLFPYTTLFRSRGPHVADLERLEFVRLLGGEVVLPNQVRDAREKLLVLEHQDLGVENARLVHPGAVLGFRPQDRKSTRLNSSHGSISYAVFCLK